LQEVISKRTKFSGCFQYYRGHGNSNFKLLSFLARFFSDIKLLEETEMKLISDLHFRIEQSKYKEYFHAPQNFDSFDQEWYWLTQVQHLGIPTRFLDWTLNIEIALYFAVSDAKCQNKDGNIWVFFIPDQLNIYNQSDHISRIKPFQFENYLFLNIPVQWNASYERNEPQRNILAQQGKFFIRSLAKLLTPLEDESNYQEYLLRYKIQSFNKPILMKQLKILDYSNKTIYKTNDKSMQDLKRELMESHNLIKKKCCS